MNNSRSLQNSQTPS